MIENRKRIILAIAATCVLLIGQVVYANTREAGSSDDPLVTLSLVEQKIEQIKYYVDEKLKNNAGGPSPNPESSFEVVELKAGSSLIGGQGTEVILRSGRAIAIDSPLGGLSDVTGAKDLVKDENVPANHLLIIPRDDSRGIKAVTDVFAMVKGSYEIRQ